MTILKQNQDFSIIREASEARNKKVNKIEKLKELNTPISFYKNLQDICKNGIENLKDEEKSYLLKCFGFFLKKDNTFMLRVRVNYGKLTPIQAIKIGEISKQYAQNYIDITTRSQIELRYLKFEDLYNVITQLDSVGITTFQTGIDNLRGIVTSSFDGNALDSQINCAPIIDEMTQLFLKNEEYIGTLPRKFNTAILGTTTNDCNIYGHDCSFILASKDNEIGFNLYLGGKVGIQAKCANLFVKKENVIIVFNAVLNLFKIYGFRDNRNKNRLHFLLEEIGINEFVKSIKKYSELNFKDAGVVLVKNEFKLTNSGIYSLKDEQSAIHFSIPSGILSGDDLIQAGYQTQETNGCIKLSVEQSFYIITKNENIEKIKNSEIYKKFDSFHNIYFNNLIACAGTQTCSFGVIPNKPDAIKMAHYLHSEIPMEDGKIRMYWSACPKGCGIHSIADIGFEGCIAKDEEGNRCYGVHIFLGGKGTKEAKEARQLCKAIPLEKAKYLIKELVLIYKNQKIFGESFESFDNRVLSNLSVEQIQHKIGL